MNWEGLDLHLSGVTCMTPDLDLSQGIGMAVSVTGQIAVKKTSAQLPVRVELSGLSVSAEDGFGNLHPIQVERGAFLDLVP